MASVPTYAPTEYGNFDPSQWSNPYSNFQNSALPFPSSYSGWPTDSMGNPIQAPPGMTLNSTPQAAAPQAAAPSGQTVGQGTMQALGMGGNPQAQNMLLSSMGMGPGVQNSIIGQSTGQQAAATPAAHAANPSGLTSQQYLQLLAHPNPVQTPGATVPQSAQGYQPNNNVLQQVLANWNPAQSGPGSGFQKAFGKALGKGS